MHTAISDPALSTYTQKPDTSIEPHISIQRIEDTIMELLAIKHKCLETIDRVTVANLESRLAQEQSKQAISEDQALQLLVLLKPWTQHPNSASSASKLTCRHRREGFYGGWT